MKYAASFALVVLLAVLAGCASTAPPFQQTDPKVAGLLTQAGFKTVGAVTPDQKAHLQSMAKDQMTVYTNTGRDWYIYPDSANGRIYVGTPKEYQAYMGLRAQSGMGPPPSIAEQSYQKQDAQMRVNTQKDIQNPWGFWPSFDNLGWQ
jgi:hypothetical protein